MAGISPPASNKESKFSPFSLTLANGATVTVGIHGGTCTAHNYDIDPSRTLSTISSALGVPFVAINRPSYPDSSTLIIPEDSSFHRETGRWEHEYILPMLWDEFGAPSGCTGVVLSCHSMAVPGAVVAAALWAREPTPRYPLAGLIFSGWGTSMKDHEEFRQPPSTGSSVGKVPTSVKKLMMLSEDEYEGLAYDPEVLPMIELQNVAMPSEEMMDGRFGWFNWGPRYATDVNVPIMYSMGEYDWLWEGSQKYIKEFEEMFVKCPQFDGSSIAGAPHALEWSKMNHGWNARSFGWAIEVCAAKRT